MKLPTLMFTYLKGNPDEPKQEAYIIAKLNKNVLFQNAEQKAKIPPNLQQQEEWYDLRYTTPCLRLFLITNPKYDIHSLDANLHKIAKQNNASSRIMASIYCSDIAPSIDHLFEKNPDVIDVGEFPALNLAERAINGADEIFISNVLSKYPPEDNIKFLDALITKQGSSANTEPDSWKALQGPLAPYLETHFVKPMYHASEKGKQALLEKFAQSGIAFMTDSIAVSQMIALMDGVKKGRIPVEKSLLHLELIDAIHNQNFEKAHIIQKEL